MSIQAKFEQASMRQNQRQDKLRLWKASASYGPMFSYIAWRSRFPLLTFVTTRVLLLLEIYFLFYYLRFETAAAVSLLAFGFYVMREPFKGVVQYYRLQITHVQAESKTFFIELLGRRLVIIAVTYGLVCGVVMISGIIMLLNDSLLALVALVWAIVLPLELTASALWMVVYTTKRLRRNFFIIIAFRFLPLIALVLFHPFLGLYSYLGGLLLSRLLESLYLAWLAANDLKNLGVDIKGALLGPGNTSYSPVHASSLLPYICFYGSLTAYCLILGVILYLRDPYFWIFYLVLFHLSSLIGLFALRVVRSLEMDIYLALKKGHSALAEFFSRRASQIGLFLAFSIAVGGFFLSLMDFSYLSFKYPLILQYLPLLFIYFFAHFFFEQETSLYRAGGMERRVASMCVVSLLCLGIPLHIYTLLIHRGNFSVAILTDFLLFLFLGAALWSKRSFIKSPYLIDPQILAPSQARLLSLPVWSKACALALQMKKRPLLFYLIQLDDFYLPRHRKPSFLAHFFAGGGEHFALPLLNGLYLVCNCEANHKMSESEFQHWIFREYSGHIRDAFLIDPDLGLKNNLESINLFSKRVPHLRKKNKAVWQRLERLLARWDHFSLHTEGIRKACLNTNSSVNLHAYLESALRGSGMPNLPAVSISQTGITRYGKVDAFLLEYALDSIPQHTHKRPALQVSHKQFCSFNLASGEVYCIDGRTLQSQSQQEELFYQCFIWNLGLAFLDARESHWPRPSSEKSIIQLSKIIKNTQIGKIRRSLPLCGRSDDRLKLLFCTKSRTSLLSNELTQ